MTDSRSRRAFSLVELLTVLSIMGILSSMLFPSLSRAREVARRTVCASNLRQIGMATQMYLEDFDDRYPLPTSVVSYDDPTRPPECNPVPVPVNWGDLLFPYSKSAQIFRCPSSSGEVRSAVIPRLTLLDSCPPVGGGGGSSGGGGGVRPPCPPVNVTPKVLFYSYGLNALDDDDIWWENSPGLPKGRHGFGMKGTVKSCAVNVQLTSISSVAVETPERSIYVSDAQPFAKNTDATMPSFISDGQLPYAATNDGVIRTSKGDIPPTELPTRIGSRHSGGFVALFADGHVKWQNSNAAPNLWTVGDD